MPRQTLGTQVICRAIALLCVVQTSRGENHASTNEQHSESECVWENDVQRDEYGWSSTVPEYQTFITSSVCDIPRISELTPQEFARKFHNKYPVIFNAEDNSLFRNLTSRESLLTTFGQHRIVLSTANTFSHDKFQSTLYDYVLTHVRPQRLGVRADKTMYHFGDNKYTEWDSLFSQYQRPGVHTETQPKTGTLSFGLGGSGSGVFFHVHGPAYAEVIHGRKRWFLYEPDHTPNPVLSDAMTTQQWVWDIYPHMDDRDKGHRKSTHGIKPLECTVEVGEVIYIPSAWYHATLNIGDSVFVSTFT